MNKFRLPLDITVSKARVQGQWIYTFRHKEIGELGRIRLKEVNDRTWINGETIGDQDDPMTAKRQAIFEPVGKELAVQMERILGKSVADGHLRLHHRLNLSGPCSSFLFLGLNFYR